MNSQQRKKGVQMGLVLLLIVWSLEIVVLALTAMHIARHFLMPFTLLYSITMVFSGILGFASGTLVFWYSSVKLSRREGGFKR